MDGWYFLKSTTTSFLNEVLSLPAIGDEQDWEVELADKKRWREFFHILSSLKFPRDSDEEVALAALLIGSIDDAISEGDFSESDSVTVSALFQQRPILSSKVYSIWCTQRKPFNSEIITPWLLPPNSRS